MDLSTAEMSTSWLLESSGGLYDEELGNTDVLAILFLLNSLAELVAIAESERFPLEPS